MKINSLIKSLASYVPIIVLVVSMMATLYVWQMTNTSEQRAAQTRFDYYKQILLTKIDNQLNEYRQALRGAAGLFHASTEVTRSDWKHYVDTLAIQENYPGIQGMGFVKYVRDANKQNHIQSIRNRDLTDYDILPAGKREVYGPIVYLEPFDWRNQRAFGFDMWSDASRRNAMKQAIDTGSSAVTDKVILMQETLEDTQVGFLMYLPVFERGGAKESIEDRYQNLYGFVYSPFRMKDLMSQIMLPVKDVLEVQIYDGGEISTYNNMFNSNPDAVNGKTKTTAMFTSVENFQIRGQSWTIVISSGKGFETFVKSSAATYVLVSGTIISILLFVVAWSLTTSRQRAVRLADKMTKDLRVSEERYALAVEGSNDGIWDWNIENKTVYYAPRFKSLLGYKDSEVDETTRWVDKLIHPEDYDATIQAFTEHLKHKKPLDIECRLQNKNKEYLWFRVKGQAIWDSNGRAMRMAGSLSDINDKKQAAIYLQAQTRELEVANKYKSEFLANMSHELRTPLNSVMVLSNLLAENKHDHLDEKEKEQAQIIYRAGSDLLALISEILDLSKIEAGQMEVVIEKLNLRDFASEIEMMFNQVASDAGLVFKVNVDKDVQKFMYTDHKRLFQVIKNLVSNALKFTEQGGITINFYKPRSVAGINDSLKLDETLAISVTDTGMGVPNEKFDLIFESFKQGDGTTRRKYGGTGLGLSISKEIMHLLDGGITLESEEGKGSTFTVYVPMNENNAAVSQGSSTAPVSIMPAEAPQSSATPQTEEVDESEPFDARVLLVDDDIRNIYALTALLERHGCTVVSAENGQLSLDTLEKDSNFDLIIMDMMMPVMDGYTATEAIKANPKLKGIPVIALTAKAMPGDREKCINAGADDYIPKPVKRAELAPVLVKFLKKDVA